MHAHTSSLSLSLSLSLSSCLPIISHVFLSPSPLSLSHTHAQTHTQTHTHTHTCTQMHTLTMARTQPLTHFLFRFITSAHLFSTVKSLTLLKCLLCFFFYGCCRSEKDLYNLRPSNLSIMIVRLIIAGMNHHPTAAIPKLRSEVSRGPVFFFA